MSDTATISIQDEFTKAAHSLKAQINHCANHEDPEMLREALDIWDKNQQSLNQFAIRLFSGNKADPLYNAAAYGSSQALKTLLERPDADPNAVIQLGHNAETTLICAAVQRNNSEAVRILLEANADPNIRNNYKETPLHIAAQHDAWDVVKPLLDFGANPNAMDEDGRTPYDAAKATKHDEFAGKLKGYLEGKPFDEHLTEALQSIKAGLFFK